MMARSPTRSNQRPDTLMQDRKADRSTKPSCNARPDHTLGSRNEPAYAGARCARSGRSSYNPNTKLLYIPALTACVNVSIDREKHNKERGWNGGLSQTTERFESNLTAVD